MILASAPWGTGKFYPFSEFGLFSDFVEVQKPGDLTKEHTLVVWGGADISPILYGHPISSFTHAGPPSTRDQKEWALMKGAKALGIPIIGVCRGAQMLCALAGGTLIQHVDNHAGTDHYVYTHDRGDNYISVNSLHHQMMNPEGVEHELLAWSMTNLSKRYIVKDDQQFYMEKEPEYIYFPKVRGHAIQWHPEFLDSGENSTHFIIDTFRAKELK